MDGHYGDTGGPERDRPESHGTGEPIAFDRSPISRGTRLRYLYGPGGIPLELSVTMPGGQPTSYAYQLDAGGSVVSLTTSAGVAVATYAYDPWGNATSVGGSDSWLAARQPLRYRGYYLDAETGLYYLPAATGRPDLWYEVGHPVASAQPPGVSQTMLVCH